MFKVDDKNNRARSLTYFAPFCSVSIVDVNTFLEHLKIRT